jgi:hypothetical protein
MRLRLFADYHQIHLLDAGHTAHPGVAEAWTAQATEDRLAEAGDIAAFGTERKEVVSVDLQVLDAEPAPDPSRWDHVTSCSLRVDSGTLVVMGCTDYLPEAKRVALPPGTWRVRASHVGLAGKVERIRLQLWPSARADPCVEKRFVPPPAKPARRVVKARTAKQAAKLARQGETDRALEVLLPLSASGDAAAAASAAELLAFRGQWAKVVAQATKLLANPGAVHAGNVFTDMCRLIRRAARELNQPSIIERAAAVVPAPLAPQRDAVLIEGRVDSRVQSRDDLEHFRRAVAEAEQGKRFAGKPKELVAHCFALAVAYDVDDEIVARYDPRMRFDHAKSVARVLARRGDGRAWSVIHETIARWWPVDHAQVAPVDLLADPWLSTLMTPERCEVVLSTPRGAEAI